MYKRLYRSTENRVIAGVCGGVAEYFNIDPAIARVVWIIAGIIGGSGIVAYIIAMIIMPLSTEASNNYNSRGSSTDESYEGKYGEDWSKKDRHSTFDSGRSGNVLGIILIVLGAFFLLRQFGILYWVRSEFSIAFVLIAIGAFIIYRGKRRS